MSRTSERARMAAATALTVSGLAVGTVGMATAVAPASHADDPTGGNGTIKVAGHGEIDDIPENAPHETCTFALEWYGFDEGEDLRSTVTFALVAPTSGGTLGVDGPAEVYVGEDPASGGTDLDAREVYELTPTGVAPAAQGYHVTVTVSAPSPKGGTETFTKTFWVAPCDLTTETPTTETPTTETPTTETPTTETPTTETPTTETPTTETPTTETPTTETPTTETPTTETPTTETPTTETPTTETPTTETPTTETPTTTATPEVSGEVSGEASGEVGGVAEQGTQPAGVPTRIDAGLGRPAEPSSSAQRRWTDRDSADTRRLGLSLVGGGAALFALGLGLALRTPGRRA